LTEAAPILAGSCRADEAITCSGDPSASRGRVTTRAALHTCVALCLLWCPVLRVARTARVVPHRVLPVPLGCSAPLVQHWPTRSSGQGPGGDQSLWPVTCLAGTWNVRGAGTGVGANSTPTPVLRWRPS